MGKFGNGSCIKNAPFKKTDSVRDCRFATVRFYRFIMAIPHKDCAT
ncbi:hypothetical protein RUMCAL_01638, partial [Ruminococcus callidus ATCC 27760]